MFKKKDCKSMKRAILLCLFIIITVAFAGCMSANKKAASEKSNEPEKGSFEWFVQFFVEDIKGYTKSNVNTADAAISIEDYFPLLYNVDVKTFDIENEDNVWYYELGSCFGYLYYFYEDDAQYYVLGESGLKTLYAIWKEDSSEFNTSIEQLKTAGENARLKLEVKTLADRIDQGQYKVGTDIAPGEYAVFSTGERGYFSVCSDANGSDIIYNDNFTYNSFITVNDGEYLELSRAYAIPLSENDVEINTDGAGMFRVGIDIPAGEYKVIADADKGYYCIYPSSRHGDIIANDNFTGQSYVTVKEGQYLELSRCRIER